MNITNFVYYKEGAMPDDMCDSIVEQIEYQRKLSSSIEKRTSEGIGTGEGKDQFPNRELGRSDFQVFMPAGCHFKFNEINNCVFDCLDEYKQTISSVDTQILVSDIIKLQYTPIGGGYHQWHIEQGGSVASARSLAWIVYLNDVEEGGETEFLYQGIRTNPKKGSVAIWPAGITHPHRGNPPLSNDKYIATGWFSCPYTETFDVSARYLKVNS